ncbi:VWA domain-containing protein [Candidatus Pacearchaeota archaeon]|nr:VWA domain-containing protein [Candidatus Pacearchaeota archaeon]
MAVEFTHPKYLFLLGIIPLIIIIHFIALKRKRINALKFANFEAIARVKGVDLISKNIFILILTVIISILIILALSGMSYERILPSSSSSFMIAIDNSKSMEATDFPPSRLEAAKETASLFVDTLPTGTKVGVVSFSGNTFIEERITDDKELIKQAIKKIPLSAIGGTDLNDAIVTSSNLLEGEEAKTIILLSDGRINVGTLDDAIIYANNAHVIVHTVGIGTTEGGLTSFGLSKADEDSLKGIALNTNGRFFKAENKEELGRTLSEIVDLKLKKVPLNLAPYFILAALAIFIFEYILFNTRYKVLP